MYFHLNLLEDEQKLSMGEFDKCNYLHLLYIILYSLTMVIVSNFVLILKSYATLPILVIHVDFERF